RAGNQRLWFRRVARVSDPGNRVEEPARRKVGSSLILQNAVVQEIKPGARALLKLQNSDTGQQPLSLLLFAFHPSPPPYSRWTCLSVRRPAHLRRRSFVAPL